ncbi:ATP12 family chaperone protein [Histidinibacterium aquaticum]|uniref:ATPase n=1 Tax=Histidinibacterium aquaticum TaxID=2613962 RepID=A0A5J5GRA9_9RHOB|nr:ATP12 family protein [Histidinibacterium aquaticum]KAA9010635.1 ATPase [Histidinibacterium aquaticum]
MSEWKLKRFWTEAAVVEAERGYEVRLDGRQVRTPAKAALRLPNRALAEASAEEWNAQEGAVDPMTMPVTRAANSAIDKVIPQFDEVAEMIAEYGGTDLLCYRAETPDELVRRQQDGWDPLLDWAAERLGARLRTGAGVMYVPQDPDAIGRLDAQVRALDPFRLTPFADLVSLSGSLVLAFAVAEGARAPADAWALSRIDEDWQIEQWGEDTEASEAAAVKRAAFLDAARIFDLAGR